MEKEQLEKLIKNMKKEDLQKVLVEIVERLSEEQKNAVITFLIEQKDTMVDSPIRVSSRMSQELVAEKMLHIQTWMEQIEAGELYLEAEGYEDYSSGYWDSEWEWNYYDNCDIGGKIKRAANFAEDCMNDYRYEEALTIFDQILNLDIQVQDEDGCEDMQMDLETMQDNDLINVNITHLALQTLYAEYQMQNPEERAGALYTYFQYPTFRDIHIEEMFRVGREELSDSDRFWDDWIRLLEGQLGEVATRLLYEAVYYYKGADGLAHIAENNFLNHPSLCLSALEEYSKIHAYSQMESLGKKALSNINAELVIRGKIALKTAYASSCLGHSADMRLFCYEAFRSNTTIKNYLRLYAETEMAEQYGYKGREVLRARIKGNPVDYGQNMEIKQNIIGDYDYYALCFYTGDFKLVKDICKNPKNSLGWSGSFIGTGISMFLLFLYSSNQPVKAMMALSNSIGFSAETEKNPDRMSFENEIAEESLSHNTTIFWNLFQRWKTYHPMDKAEKESYLSWAEKIVYSRADAIVSGQHRRQYRDVTILLAAVGEVKESLGYINAKTQIQAVYKRKFPRHSSFQGEMRVYFSSI